MFIQKYPLVMTNIAMENDPFIDGLPEGNDLYMILDIVTYTLWLCQNSYWKWWFIVDFPIDNGGSFHGYVKLPEGRTKIHWFLHLIKRKKTHVAKFIDFYTFIQVAIKWCLSQRTSRTTLRWALTSRSAMKRSGHQLIHQSWVVNGYHIPIPGYPIHICISHEY